MSPPNPPWRAQTLDCEHPVEAMAVEDKHVLPPGINVTVIDRARVLIETVGGWEELQTGDFIYRLPPGAGDAVKAALGMDAGQCARMSCDDARRRLT